MRWLPTGGVAIQEVDTKRLGQVAARYLGNLAAGQRELAASEINRFVRHIGPDRPVTQITKLEVERYQNYLTDTVGDAATQRQQTAELARRERKRCDRAWASPERDGLVVVTDTTETPFAVLPASQVVRFIVPGYVQDDPGLASVVTGWAPSS